MRQQYLQDLFQQLKPEHQQTLLNVLIELQQNAQSRAVFLSQNIEDFLNGEAPNTTRYVEDVAQSLEIQTVDIELDLNTETLFAFQHPSERELPSAEVDLEEAQKTVALEADSSLTELASLETNPLEKASISKTYLGRYVDLGRLGVGGMGEVRLVLDKTLNRKLAMKIIHPKLIQSRAAISRFIEEAQIGAQLQYPNIVPIHELGRLEDGRLYFTMKQIKGQEFTHLIDQVHDAASVEAWGVTESGVTFRRLIQIFHTICETIAFAHSLGVVHRDLKPDNIMIGDFGEVLVVDWGIAKVLGQDRSELDDGVQTNRSTQDIMATRVGAITGTPIYMSPEQAMGRNDLIGPHSDIYTLGAILYELLSGIPPYTGHSVDDVIEKVKNTRPPSLRSSTADAEPNIMTQAIQLSPISLEKIPLELVQICERAMSREMNERYVTASELAKDIASWLEGAQKRDKALAEFEKALESQQQFEANEADAIQLWAEANALIEVEGVQSEAAWELWRAAKQQKAEAQRCLHAYQKGLQSALVYEPNLVEANEAMAKGLLDDLLVAIANGDRRRSQLESQFHHHLKTLSMQTQERLLLALNTQSRDNIVLSRARRGSLVGRQSLMRHIQNILEDKALVTLVGTGGAGKTRLALEVIHQYQAGSAQVIFCDLTDATTELGVVMAVAKSMNIQLRDIDPVGQMADHFVQETAILVLDNLEQVIAAAGAVITAWLTAAQSLKIIATSRMKLRLPFENVVSVPPLSVLEGIELFVTRAQTVNAQLTLENLDFSAIGRLNDQLDRLPLAIELAAARLNIFSLAELEQRLNERFSLLRSQDSDIQALQGALDWSWGLLQPWAQQALAQLSVFHGGFERKAAEGVLKCSDQANMPPVVDILHELVEASLLQRISETGDVRYTLLESVRQYGRVRLKSFESTEQVQLRTVQRHSEYYAQFGARAYLADLERQHDSDVWKRFLAEQDNFLAGATQGAGSAALNCCMAAIKILDMKGPMSLGVDLTGQLLEKPELTPLEQKQLRTMRMRFLRISGRVKEARQQVQHSQPDSFEVGADDETVFFMTPAETTSSAEAQICASEDKESLYLEAEQFLEQADLEEAEAIYAKAEEYYRSALRIFQQLGEAKGTARAHLKLGLMYMRQSRSAESHVELDQALDLAQQFHFRMIEADVYQEKSTLFNHEGRYDEALAYIHQALHINTEAGHQPNIARNLGKLGLLVQKQGDNDTAISYFERSIELSRQIGDKRIEAHSLGNLATLYEGLAEYDKALAYFDAALKLNRTLNNQRSIANNLGNLGLIFRDRSQLDKALAYFLESVTLARDIKHLDGLCRNLGKLASVYSALGQFENAILAFQEAIQVDEATNNKSSKCSNLINLGVLYSDYAQLDKAALCYQEAIQIAQAIKELKNEGIAQGNLGAVYAKLERSDAALLCYQKSIQIARKIDNKRSEGINLGNLAEIYAKSGQLDKAEAYYHQAIQLCAKVTPHFFGFFLGELAWVQVRNGHEAAALDSLTKGVAMAGKRPFIHCLFLCNTAKVRHWLGQADAAQAALSEAIQLADELQSPAGSEQRDAIDEVRTLFDEHTAQANTSVVPAIDFEALQIEAEALLEKGLLAHAKAELETAGEAIQEALQLFRQIEDANGCVRSLLQLGVVRLHQAQYEHALSFFEAALTRSEENQFVRLKAAALGHIGKLHFEKHDFSKATEFLNQALTIYQAQGDHQHEGQLLGDLGAVCLSQQDYARSTEYFTQALKLHRTIGNVKAEAQILGNIALNWMCTNDLEQAIDCFTQALELNRQIENRKGEGHVLHNLGKLYSLQYDYAQAVHYATAAESIAQHVGNLKSLVNSIGNKGIAYLAQGNNLDAQASFQKALTLALQIEQWGMAELNQAFLGSALFRQHKYSEALENYKAAQVLARKCQNPRREGIVLGNLGTLYSTQELWAEANHALSQAMTLCLKTAPPAFGSFAAEKAWVLLNQGQPLEAILTLTESESYVRSHDIEYGKFLSQKVKILSFLGQHARAQAAFDALQTYVEGRPFSINIEIRMAIQNAAHALSTIHTTA